LVDSYTYKKKHKPSKAEVIGCNFVGYGCLAYLFFSAFLLTVFTLTGYEGTTGTAIEKIIKTGIKLIENLLFIGFLAFLVRWLLYHFNEDVKDSRREDARRRR